jgi:SAM-dependent methyltransferase
MDNSAEMLSHAIHDARVCYVKGQAEQMPFGDAAFGLMTVALALHWFDRRQFMIEARRVLRPGGWLVIYTDGFYGRIVPSNRTPVAAVPAMIAIVAQGEVRVRRHDEFSLLDIAENLFGPLRLQAWRQFICPDWRKVEKKRIVRRSRIVVGERLILLLPIEIDLMVQNLDVIAGHSDDPFNVSRVVLIRKLEDDQIAPLRRMTPIVPCVRNDSIFRSERGKHGCCSHFIGAKSRHPVGNVAPHGEDVD